MNTRAVSRLGVLAVLLLPAATAAAASLPGAIFTTTPGGTIVNENVRYDAKIEVYLDGGPGPNAPQTAAGLPDGDYVFQVTDPSGKVLLSEDASKCRVVRVQMGVIVALRDLTLSNSGVISGITDHFGTDTCHVNDEPDGEAGTSGRHDTNTDFDHGPPAIVVQLMPFFDTPNPGGVYKAWIIPLDRYLANGGSLKAVPQDYKLKGVKLGYQRDAGFGPPRDQVKTDNFKVKEFFPPEIKVRKFHDLNGNGVWDAGEPEIGLDQCVDESSGDIVACPGGWPYNFTEPVDGGGTVTNKFYTPHTHVAGIAGTYTACELHLTGWTQSAAYVDGVKSDASQCVNVAVAGTSGEKHEIVFGNFRDGTKSGRKFHDLNGNGKEDAGEPGLPGWTITLNGKDGQGNAVSQSATTDGSGNYTLSVPPGSYKVCEVQQVGWTQSYPAAGCYDITLTSGQVDSGNDFGNFKNATKSGMKFHDPNGNGQKDAGEPGLSGWTIKLDGTDGQANVVSKSTTTDGTGKYSFSVPPGVYTVCEVQQAGWTQSHPSGDGCYHITLASGDTDSDNDFGNFKNATKSGMKFNDTNGNHLKDAGEGGLANWTITLSGKDGQGNSVSKSTTTNGSGSYSFSVPPGTYTVCETPQAGWVQTFPTSGEACANGTIGYKVTLTSGQVEGDNDFGNRPNQGCTPGYWKVTQHWDSWPPPWTPLGPLSGMFVGVANPPYATQQATGYLGLVAMGSASQVDALNFQGGDTVPEKAEILLRAGVAAELNATSSGIHFPWTPSQVVNAVNAALASQDANTILNLATQLDNDNNGPGGCPLN